MEGKKSVLNPINFNRVHTKMHKVFFLNYHICEQFIFKIRMFNINFDSNTLSEWMFSKL
jgi:hypothetical protein